MFSDKVAVVTGAARGIGKGIALRLAKNGAKVVVNYAGSEAAANEVVETIKAEGGEAYAYKCNVASYAEVEAMMADVVEKYGRIDILVNNAGITKDKLILKMTEQDFEDVIDVNLKGAFNGIKAVTKQMMKQRYGRIINLSSVVGAMGNAGQANYCASKGGVVGLTMSAARELAARNITWPSTRCRGAHRSTSTCTCWIRPRGCGTEKTEPKSRAWPPPETTCGLSP
jgi:3-oxoacyl-[acyl-carrier protein] reductase